MVIPVGEGLAAWIFRGRAFQSRTELDLQPVGVSVNFEWQKRFRSSETDSLQTSIPCRAGLPSGGTDYIELAVDRVEGTAHGAGKKFPRQLRHRRLRQTVNHLAQNDKFGTAPKRKVQKMILQRSPAVAGNPKLATAGIVHLMGNPAQRKIVSQWSIRCCSRPAKSVPPSRFGLGNNARRGPLALLRC